MTDKKTLSPAPERVYRIPGAPGERQRAFFEARGKYIAYGGARGGGKSWALRRKLVGLCLVYPGIRCLLVRRSLGELKANHLEALLREYGDFLVWSEGERTLRFPNGSVIFLGYCSSARDALRYQGQEYDIIAIDEATQLTEAQFSVFKACLRGVADLPRRLYLTCNPGGIGHAWVKRLFIDRDFREGEIPEDYVFIPALVYDNHALLKSDPEYIARLESLPPRMREAWLYGRWDLFEGQFFPEFDESRHVCEGGEIPACAPYFIAFDYGFDMLAALLLGCAPDGCVYVLGELCVSGLTLGEAARRVAAFAEGYEVAFAVASPDLWNRRQDSGRSGFEIMQAVPGMPPMRPADNRRIPGWRVVREYLAGSGGSSLRIARSTRTLISSMQSLLCDASRAEDAADEPHAVTHAPEALRYALMSRAEALSEREGERFRFPGRGGYASFTTF